MIDFRTLEALVESGATAEMVVAAVRAMVSSAACKKSAGRERTRRWRERKDAAEASPASQSVTKRHGDVYDPPASPPLNNPLPSPTEIRGGGGRTRASDDDFEGIKVSAEALAFVDEIAALCDQDPKNPTFTWVNARPGVLAQTWISQGWPVDHMREVIKAAVREKRDGPPHSIKYFEKILKRHYRDPQLPLSSIGVVGQPGVIHAEAQFRPASDWRVRRDNGHAALAELRDSIADHERAKARRGERD